MAVSKVNANASLLTQSNIVQTNSINAKNQTNITNKYSSFESVEMTNRNMPELYEKENCCWYYFKCLCCCLWCLCCRKKSKERQSSLMEKIFSGNEEDLQAISNALQIDLKTLKQMKQNATLAFHEELNAKTPMVNDNYDENNITFSLAENAIDNQNNQKTIEEISKQLNVKVSDIQQVIHNRTNTNNNVQKTETKENK